jgi:hypothetical protein
MTRFVVGGVVGYFWDFPFPVFNGAVRPRFSVETADAGIEAFLAEARARGVPMPWSLMPGSEPPDLGPRLAGHGFQRTDVLTGMAVDLATLNPEALPADVRIQRVSDADTLDIWMTRLAEGYSFPAWLPEPLTLLMAHAGLTDEAPWSLYLVWLNGRWPCPWSSMPPAWRVFTTSSPCQRPVGTGLGGR